MPGAGLLVCTCTSAGRIDVCFTGRVHSVEAPVSGGRRGVAATGQRGSGSVAAAHKGRVAQRPTEGRLGVYAGVDGGQLASVKCRHEHGAGGWARMRSTGGMTWAGCKRRQTRAWGR